MAASSNERRCPSCGHAVETDANFCHKCGARLDADESTVTLVGIESDQQESHDRAFTSVPALEPGQAVLVVTKGPNEGSRFFLEQEITRVGRHPDSDIQLDDVTVSRRHAEFLRAPSGKFRLRDVGSLNGTYVNHKRVDETDLSSGDQVQIGRYRMVFYTATQDHS